MIKRNLGSVAMSLTELLIGILLLVNPVAFTSGIIIAFGIVLMLIGLGTTVRYFRREPEEAAVGLLLVKGLLALLCGAFCTFRAHWFLTAFPVLSLVYGGAVLVSGITKLQWTVDMIRMKRSRWLWLGISAGISIACGITVMANPFTTSAVLWMFMGISLIVDAVFDMIGGLYGNREKQNVTQAQTE